jgi:hypothetical protein
MSRKCEHGMMPWECIDCTDLANLIKKKRIAKQFIDANVWDGEDRSGAINDRATFSPDDLQELIDDLIEEWHFN